MEFGHSDISIALIEYLTADNTIVLFEGDSCTFTIASILDT